MKNLKLSIAEIEPLLSPSSPNVLSMEPSSISVHGNSNPLIGSKSLESFVILLPTLHIQAIKKSGVFLPPKYTYNLITAYHFHCNYCGPSSYHLWTKISQCSFTRFLAFLLFPFLSLLSTQPPK